MNQTDVTWYKEKIFFYHAQSHQATCYGWIYTLWQLHDACLPVSEWMTETQPWFNGDVVQTSYKIYWQNQLDGKTCDRSNFFWMWKHPQHPHVHVWMVKKNEHLISLCIHTIKSLIRYEVIRVSVLFATGYQKLQLRWLRFVFSCKAANNLEYENATESKK